MREFAIPEEDKPKAQNPDWIHRQALFGKAKNRRAHTTFNQWNASERKKRNAAAKMAADMAAAASHAMTLTDYRHHKRLLANVELRAIDEE